MNVYGKGRVNGICIGIYEIVGIGIVACGSVGGRCEFNDIRNYGLLIDRNLKSVVRNSSVGPFLSLDLLFSFIYPLL